MFAGIMLLLDRDGKVKISWFRLCQFARVCNMNRAWLMLYRVAFTRFALHVVDRVFVPNIGIKAKDHFASGFPRSCR